MKPNSTNAADDQQYWSGRKQLMLGAFFIAYFGGLVTYISYFPAA
jgi:hypothetical protein